MLVVDVHHTCKRKQIHHHNKKLRKEGKELVHQLENDISGMSYFLGMYSHLHCNTRRMARSAILDIQVVAA